jgi:hypothetical protein
MVLFHLHSIHLGSFGDGTEEKHLPQSDEAILQIL